MSFPFFARTRYAHNSTVDARQPVKIYSIFSSATLAILYLAGSCTSCTCHNNRVSVSSDIKTMKMKSSTSTIRGIALFSALLVTHRSVCQGSSSRNLDELTDDVLFAEENDSDIPSDAPSFSPMNMTVAPTYAPSTNESYWNDTYWNDTDWNVTDDFILIDENTTMPSESPTKTPTKDPSSAPSSAPSDTPTKAPTEVPSVSPTMIVTYDKCFDDLNEIYEIEKAIDDTRHIRKYVLCPGKTYSMGNVDENGEISGGQTFLMLRPNVIYSCGEDGNRANDCVLSGGDFALASFYGIFDGIYETVDNVVIEGLTFEDQELFGVVLEAAGDITFIDCMFKDQENVVPILIQWNGDGPEPSSRRLSSPFQQSPTHTVKMIESDYEEEGVRYLGEETLHHRVTFQDCIFRDNKANKEIGFPGIIENTYKSELVIYNCLFENNDYGEFNTAAPYGYAIRSFGPVAIDSTCFNNNDFVKDGPILVYGAPYTSHNNFATSSHQTLNCDFLALFREPRGYFESEHPNCVAQESDICRVDLPLTPAPTLMPTLAPVNRSPIFFSGSAPRINRMHAVLMGSVFFLLFGF